MYVCMNIPAYVFKFLNSIDMNMYITYLYFCDYVLHKKDNRFTVVLKHWIRQYFSVGAGLWKSLCLYNTDRKIKCNIVYIKSNILSK